MPTRGEDYQDLKGIWQGGQLNIPKYQRQYAWGEEQRRDLIQDLDYVRNEMDHEDDEDDDKISHFFGTIVLDDQGEENLPDPLDETWEKYNVVDGQQRTISTTILVECIVEIVDTITDKLDDDEAELVEDNIVDDKKQRFIEHYTTRRLIIENDDDWDVFKKLVYDRATPEEVERLGEYTIPSQRRLIAAKKDFRDWIIEDILITETLGGDDDIQSDYDDLKNGNTDVIDDNPLDAEGPLQILNLIDQDEASELVGSMSRLTTIISERLEVTEYNVENSSEAGRIFQSINDRGRDLIMADRIKSYLIYSADRLDNPSLAQDIFESFARVAEEITLYGDEDEIDSFIKDHWRMWTGEIRYGRSGTYTDTPNDVHRRIKQLEKHASFERPESGRENWIQKYIEDLEKSAKAYQKVMHPGEFDDEDFGDEHGEEIRRNLKGVHRCSSRENVSSFLMAVYRLYARSPPILDSADMREIISLLENFSFRVYGAADKKANVRRDKLRELSHRLRWTDQASEVEDIFDTGTGYTGTRDVRTDDIFSDGEEALEQTCRALENAIGNYGYNFLFMDGLQHNDIFDGNRSTDNWNGMGRNSIRHFFWEYEFDLRDDDRDEMPSFERVKQRERDIEHIWAQKADVPDELVDEHRQYVDALGDLALLHFRDNRSEQDASYEEKYENVYENSRMDHISSLPDPDDEPGDHPWNGDKIQDRRKVLIDFAKRRWDVPTYSTVHMADDPEEVERDVKRKIIDDVRNEFDGYGDEINPGNIPKVEFTDETVAPGDVVKDRCENCDAITITVDVDDDDDMIVTCSDCGDTLSRIPYSFHAHSYV